MPEDLSPTLRRWELGGALRQIREGQNKTIDQVALDLSELYGTGFSAAKIGRLETGKRGANPRDVRDLCDYYEVDPTERDRLIALAKDARLDNRISVEATSTAEFIALESVAKTERNFEPMFVPGLLQTSAYFSAVIDSYAHAGVEPSSTSELSRSKIEIRRQRQLRLKADRPLHLRALMDENVIRRRVGSDEIMAEQLSHLITMSHEPNIILRIIPASAGLYPGCESGGFALLEFDESAPPRENSCLVGGLVNTVWAEHTVDKLNVNHIFTYMEGLAISPEETRTVISSARAPLM